MKVLYEVLNLDVLEEKAESGAHDSVSLARLRVVSGKRPVKLLGRGGVTKKFNLTLHAASGSAKEAIEKAGGSVTIVRP